MNIEVSNRLEQKISFSASLRLFPIDMPDYLWALANHKGSDASVRIERRGELPALAVAKAWIVANPDRTHFRGSFRIGGDSVMWTVSGLPITRQLSQRRFCRNAWVVTLLSSNEGNFVHGCRVRFAGSPLILKRETTPRSREGPAASWSDGNRTALWMYFVSFAEADANEPIDHQGEWQKGEYG